MTVSASADTVADACRLSALHPKVSSGDTEGM